MLKYISKQLNFLKVQPHYLGRWRIDYCQKILHNKIKYANEDHCGACGSESITPKFIKNTIVCYENCIYFEMNNPEINNAEINNMLNTQVNNYVYGK